MINNEARIQVLDGLQTVIIQAKKDKVQELVLSKDLDREERLEAGKLLSRQDSSMILGSAILKAITFCGSDFILSPGRKYDPVGYFEASGNGRVMGFMLQFDMQRGFYYSSHT